MTENRFPTVAELRATMAEALSELGEAVDEGLQESPEHERGELLAVVRSLLTQALTMVDAKIAALGHGSAAAVYPCMGCGCSAVRCALLPPPALKCCPDCLHTNPPPVESPSELALASQEGRDQQP